jgi:predicted dehydrogenase
MKRIGLMGCGVVASYGHLPAIKAVGELDLHALFDPDPKRLATAQEKFGVAKGFTDAEKFLSCGLDAVTITSPAPFHRVNVLGAARHGLHALCEKPLTMSGAEAREMIEAMEDRRLMLFTAFCYRFSPVALKIKELIDSGAIGRIGSLRLIYIWDCHGKYERARFEEKVEQRRRGERMEEGGPMFDCGTHQIDLARWWMGDVARVSGHGAWCDEYQAPDHVWAHLDHTNGAHTMIEMSYSYAHTARDQAHRFLYEIIGSQGLIRYDRDGKLFEMRTPKGTEQLPFDHEKNFEGMYAAYARALETGKPGHLSTAADGEAVTRIAREATEKAMAGRA